MQKPMLLDTADNLNIFRPIVEPISIRVVNLFAALQASASLGFRYDAVFVGIAAHIRQVVGFANPDENIPVAGNCSATLPVPVGCA